LTNQIDSQKDFEEEKLLKSNRKVLNNLFSETARDFGELVGGPKPYNSKTMGILASAFLDIAPSVSQRYRTFNGSLSRDHYTLKLPSGISEKRQNFNDFYSSLPAIDLDFSKKKQGKIKNISEMIQVEEIPKSD